jgi:NSS family neurotransmitter:Na+ symporter
MGMKSQVRETWSSQWVFILAAAGCAVGLGNIWKFPYITGENGGAAFVLVYLACILLIGVPLLIAEIYLGKSARLSPIMAMKKHTAHHERSSFWTMIGWMGVFSGALILSYYSVIAGWAMNYTAAFATAQFPNENPQAISGYFDEFLANPLELSIWHGLFMLLTLVVVARGIRGGLEKAINFLMPALFVLLLILLGYALSTGYFAAGLEFLFTPDFSKITPDVVLIAMGHAFFTLSLGFGSIMVYGSYMPEDTSIAKSALWIALLDTLIALIAGMIIFPIVFANGLEPSAGPGLIFQTLPIAFGDMAYGYFWGSLFFFVVVIAAWSSAISMIEPAISYAIERYAVSRAAATWALGLVIAVIGMGTVFSFNLWADWKILGERTFFESLDYVISNISLPLGGLLIALFVGWRVMPDHLRNDKIFVSERAFQFWHFAIRYIAPAAVIAVFVNLLFG